MRTIRAALVLALSAVLAAAVLASPPSAEAAQSGGSLLWNGYSHYPRVIRLEHNGTNNGLVVATVVTNLNGWVGATFHSNDDGRTFTHVGEARNDANAGGMCCHTLYELPTQVGAMPAGTLLWAASYGLNATNRRMSVRVLKSTDLGRTWSLLSIVTTSPSTQGLWEPEFTVANDGRLVVFYSDETDPAHSQKLVAARSTDGVTWTDFKNVVAIGAAERPGMAVVRKLPNGQFLMSYEVCGTGHNCEAYVRRSNDGWDWGNPAAIGEAVRTADGRYPGSTPTITVSGNTVFLTSMRLRTASNGFAPGDGRTILGNANNGSGAWFDVDAPIAVSDPGSLVDGVPCATYSNPLLASKDGKSILLIATDWDAANVCRAYVASGAALPAGSNGPSYAAEGGQVFASGAQQHHFDRAPNGDLRHRFDDGGVIRRDTWGTGVAGRPVTFTYSGQQHAFARRTDGALGHWFWDPSLGVVADTWATGIAGDPAATVIGNAQHVWAVDTGGALKHWWWAPGQGTQNDTWGTGLTGRPALMVVGTAQHTFTRTTTGELEHSWWNPFMGMRSERFGSGVTGDPVVVQYGDAQHVWVTGTGGALKHWWWNANQGWQNDTWATSGVTGRPAAFVYDGEQHVFARGTNGTLEHWWWRNGVGVRHDTWMTGITTDPEARVLGTEQHAWAQDSTGALKHNWWNPSTGSHANDWGP